MPRATPQSFGRYQVVRPLGAGAVGSVYLARDEELGRDVAIKVIHTHGLPEFAAEISAERFESEGRVIAALRHPHIVEVFDKGRHEDITYLVMEMARCGSLAARLEADGRLPVATVRNLAAHIGSALDAAHQRDIIHRDVKPGNILEVESEHFKLADFGVARVPDKSMTLTGQFLGSPAYSAPEAIQFGEFSPATDIYGLGATLYQALVGEPPYGPGGLMTEGALSSDAPPTPISAHRDDVPPELAAVILAMVARVPEDRPDATRLLAVANAGLPHPGGPSPDANPNPHAPVLSPPLALPHTATTPGALPHPMPPHDHAPSSRRRWAVIGGIVGALLLGLIIGSSDEDASPSASPERPYPTESRSPERDHRYEKEWHKIEQKIDEGKYHDAEKRLEKLLRHYPDDRDALELLEQLRAHMYR